MTEKPWPADAIERRSVAALIPYARNARTHSPEQVAQIAASIREWGWTTPVLIDEEGGIIAGHGRVLAARSLGIKDVPAMVARGWTEAQKRAYCLADNKLALNAGWDTELLKVELAELAALDFDMPLIGFSGDELSDLMQSGEAQERAEETPEPPVHPVTVLGDVWCLGNHRIICGSSTEASTIERLLGPVRPHLMVTDPPYGVNYDASWRIDTGLAGKGGGTATGKVLNDDRADWREAWALFPGTVAYVWHAGLFAGVVAESLAAVGFKVRSQIVWVKPRFAIGRGHYHWQHEPCLYADKGAGDQWQDRFEPDHETALYAVKEGAKGEWRGGRKQSTVWNIEHRKSDTGHSTQKPIECMKRPIENNSSAGQAIYEPFSGSGTTLMACELTNRHCFAVELNPAYVDVAINRWQGFTGLKATLEGDGRTFDEISEARYSKADADRNSSGSYDAAISELRKRAEAKVEAA